MKEKISITLSEKTIRAADSIIDNIMIRNRSQAIEYLVTKSLGEHKTAVILAGGSSEKQRVGAHYRSTVPINSIPLFERNLRKLKENGFKTVLLIAERPILTAVFMLVQEGTKHGVHVIYIEDTKSAGTMDTLRLAKGKVTNHFLVVYGDILFGRINVEALWNDHLLNNGTCTLMLTTSPDPSKKGIVKMEGTRVLEFVQKPRDSDVYLGFSSMLVAEPEIFEYTGKSLERDIFPQLAHDGALFGHLSSEKEVHIHSAKDIPVLQR